MNQPFSHVVTGSENLTPLVRAFLDEKTTTITVLDFYGVEKRERFGYLHRDVVRCAVRMRDIIELMGLDITSEALTKIMSGIHGWERVAPTSRFSIHARWWMRIDRDEEMEDEDGRPLGLIPANRFEPWPV